MVRTNADGLVLDYQISIPDICTGAFTLSNIGLSAGLILPFNNSSPSVSFAFSSQCKPFTLAVGIFGGRGFFAIEVSNSGITVLKGLLEFGAYIELNIANIASGKAFLMAGIYFRVQAGRGVYVEGYITCGGSLSIIGLIQVSVVFYLGLAYDSQSKSLRGRASLTVSISFLFFSASFTLSIEKQISGDGLAELWGSPDNEEYLATNEAQYGGRFGPNPEKYPPPAPVPTKDDAAVYCNLESPRGLIPIYDPAILFELELKDNEYDLYINQYGN